MVVGAQPGARPHGRGRAARPERAGQFFWRDPAVIAEALEEAGFVLAEIDQVDFTFRYPSLDDWWDAQRSSRPVCARGSRSSRPRSATTCATRSTHAWREHVADDGTVALPARTNVAAARTGEASLRLRLQAGDATALEGAS